MPRSIWTGSISFGLVSVPVKLYGATQPQDVRFHEMEAKSGARIRHKRVSGESDREVPYERIVKGYEVSKGNYVTLTREELESVEPGSSHTIDIEDFVDLTEIDPVYYDRTYYLAPDGRAGAKPYALLLAAMRETGKVAIGRFVLRTKQYLAVIRVSGDALVLETMFFPDEIRSVDDLPGLPVKAHGSDKEMGVAVRLIEALSSPWKPEKYHDTYRERVLGLIEAKANGEELVSEQREPSAPPDDVMAALEASLAAIEQRRGGGSGNGGRARDGSDNARPGHGSLRSLSREELYERAQSLDIPGRSKMSKDELVEALERAS